MAQPSTELNKIRQITTRMLDQIIPDLAAVTTLMDGAGTTDAERAAFFAQAINVDEGNDDITSADLNQAALKLRELQATVEAVLPDVYKLRK